MAEKPDIEDIVADEEYKEEIQAVQTLDSSAALCSEKDNDFEDGVIEEDKDTKISTKESGKNFENLELDFESDIKESEIQNADEMSEEKNEDEDKKEKTETIEKELEEGEDEGEISGDDDELEEGELKEKEQFSNKQAGRQICRFFNRGKCTFGQVCRFLHLNNNSRGNYTMFPNACGSYISPANNDPVYMMNPRSTRQSQEFYLPPVPAVEQPSALETAWERGLRAAKELVKKAHLRRTSPDFDEKRLNLPLTLNLDVPENDKENKSEKKRDRHTHTQNFYKCEEDQTQYAFGEPSWKRSYENFEIRYNNRDDVPPYREKDRSRSFRRENSPNNDKKMTRGMRRFENDPRVGGALSRKRAEEWFDPYRRSKSPKGRRSRSRSYSTVSSYSYSERSSLSQYSRSSSGSSDESSRSPSPNLSKRKSNESILSPKCDNRFLSKKKSGARSSSSRSISMDSITSGESGSSASLSGNKPHVPILLNKEEDKPAKQLFQQLQFLKKGKKEDSNKGDDPDFLDDSFSDLQDVSVPSFPSLQHLLPSSEKKEPIKAKQQIKLTLLNKNQPHKFPSIPKEPDAVKCKERDDESSNFNAFPSGVKRPLSPPSPTVPVKLPPALFPKRSAISRRDELLKQLKAVEDAIARKRGKFY